MKPHNDHPFVNTQRVRVIKDGVSYSSGQFGEVTRDHYLNCVKVLLDVGGVEVNIPVAHLEPEINLM